jgi:hypothetical protein
MKTYYTKQLAALRMEAFDRLRRPPGTSSASLLPSRTAADASQQDARGQDASGQGLASLGSQGPEGSPEHIQHNKLRSVSPLAALTKPADAAPAPLHVRPGRWSGAAVKLAAFSSDEASDTEAAASVSLTPSEGVSSDEPEFEHRREAEQAAYSDDCQSPTASLAAEDEPLRSLAQGQAAVDRQAEGPVVLAPYESWGTALQETSASEHSGQKEPSRTQDATSQVRVPM